MRPGTQTTRLMALAFLLAAATLAAAQGAPPHHTLTEAAAFETHLRAALDSGDVVVARDLMLADKGGASERVIATITDPNGKAARTAYDARRQVLDRVVDETVRRVQQDPKMRGRLVSVEVGGTAGLEGPGFSPKKSDLDFQFRGTDPEVARYAQQVAQQVMGDLGVPKHFDINPFAATMDGTRIATGTGDLNAGQQQRINESARQRGDKEAYVGDANEFVRRDYYERGAAREVRPDGTLGPTITVEELYEKQGWPPPEVTEGGAFGVAVNERNKYAALGTDAKRVGRAVDALDRVDPDALTPAERATKDLADAIYKAPDRDIRYAIQSLPDGHPVVVEWERRRAFGQTPQEAYADLLAEHETRARAIIDKAVERTLQAKLDDVAKATRMTDAEVVDHWSQRAAEGDPFAKQWLDEYRARPAAEHPEMLKVARESVAEQKRLGLVDAFLTMEPEVRTRLAAHPDFAGNSVVQNAKTLADVMGGDDPILSRVIEEAGTHMRGANEELAKAKAENPYAHLPGGRALNAADTLVTTLAIGGTLYEIAKATHEAYEKGGRAAALEAFVTRTGRTARDFSFGVALAAAAERYGMMAEGMGILLKGGTSAVLGALVVKDVIDLSRAMVNAGWRALQDPLLAGYLDPTSGSSFYQHWNTRPELLQAGVYDYALANGLDPMDTRGVLDRMIREYFGDRQGWGTNMQDMAARLRQALEAQTALSDMYLSDIAILQMTDPRLADGEPRLVRADAEERAKEAEQKAIEARKAEAEAALRRAREQRAEKEKKEKEATARAEEQAAKKTAAELVEEARRKAAEREAEEARALAEAEKRARETEAKPPPATPPSSRWNALKQQAETEARRQAAEEEAARKRTEADAARRAEEEAARRRAEEEEALLDEIDIELSVPAGLQPGGQASIGVRVRAPAGLALAGRRVQIRATPGHTDDGSVRLDGSGRGSTIYNAPADFNGVARVTVSLDGRISATRTFAVGNAADAEAPPEQTLPPPTPEITLPETPDAPPPDAPAPPSAPGESASLADGAYEIMLDRGDWRPSGVIEIRNGQASGRLRTGTTGTSVYPPVGPVTSAESTLEIEGTVNGATIDATYRFAARMTQQGSVVRAEITEQGHGRITIELKPDGSIAWRRTGTFQSTKALVPPPERASLDDLLGYLVEHEVNEGPLGGRWMKR